MFLVARRPGEAFVIVVESSERFQIFRREMPERQRDPEPE